MRVMHGNTKGMTYSDDFEISSMDELIDLINNMGFVPFFENEIEGFSLEEHIDPKCWYGGGDFWDAWEWKGPVIKKAKCAYGKFLRNKAMYISPKWFPDFANSGFQSSSPVKDLEEGWQLREERKEGI